MAKQKPETLANIFVVLKARHFMFGPPMDKNQPHPGGSLGAKNAPR